MTNRRGSKSFALIAVIYLVALSLLLNTTTVSAPSPVLISSYWDETPNSWMPLWAEHPSGINAYSAHGQVIEVSGTYRLYSAHFFLQLGGGSPTCNVSARLYETNSSSTYGTDMAPLNPENLLAESNEVNLTGIAGGGTTYNFTFSGDQQYLMTSGYYCITFVVAPSGGTLGLGDYFQIGCNQNGGFAGNRFYYYGDYAEWRGSSSRDTVHQVYGVAVTEAPDWIGIGQPYGYAAISLMSLSLIIGIAVALISSYESHDFTAFIPVIIVSLGIAIALFIALPLLNAFSGL